MRNVSALIVLIFCFSTTKSQDSLSRYQSLFGDYATEQGHRFCIGRSEQSLFLMDYGRMVCSRLTANGAASFGVENSTAKISMADRGFIYTNGDETEKAVLTRKPDTEDFLIESNGEKLGGTFWKPISKRKFPVIILVHGAGYETRYGMRYLPYYFTSLGYGVITYDKRGCGVSTGKFEPWFSGIRALAGDVIKVYQRLEKRQDIQPSAISIMGISNGAWVICNAAARLSRAEFIIPVAGSFVPVYQQELYRLHEAGIAAGLNPADLADLDSTMAALYSERVLGEHAGASGAAQMKILMQHAAGKPWLPLTPLKDFLQLPPETVYELGKAAWFNELSYNPLSDLERLICPVYSITGEQDKVSPTAQITDTINVLKKYMRNINGVQIPKASHYMEEDENGKIPALYLSTLRGILLKEKL